jgi:hypothetical protein
MEQTDDAGRIRLAFRLTTGRYPKAAEIKVLSRMQQKALETFRQDGKRATQLLSVGESRRDPELDVALVASWTIVAQAILNLDEVVSRN